MRLFSTTGGRAQSGTIDHSNLLVKFSGLPSFAYPRLTALTGAPTRSDLFTKLTIRKSETEFDGFDTRKILQYARLLMPTSVSQNDTAAEKLRAYKNPEQCLTDFSSWYEQKNNDPVAATKYNFTVQIAPYALDEYEFWESHEGWNGQYIWDETKKGGRAVRRDKAKKIIWVSPGLIFPIVGAMSEFVDEVTPGQWAIKKPPIFKPSDMISRAVQQLRGLDSDPMLMGRSAAAYDAMRIYPSTLVEVMRDLKESAKAGM